MKKCLVIIPAYNEEGNIQQVLDDIRDLQPDVDILVVNDGSTDRTADVVREARVPLISLPFNLGYGNALQTGFKYAVAEGYQYVIQFDADGQHDPGDIGIILDLLDRNGADIVLGSRFLGRGSLRTGLVKGLAIQIFRLLIRVFTGVRITDPSSGLQGLTWKVFSYYAAMGNFPPDYPDADILIQMLLLRCRVTEFPANIRARNQGHGMHRGFWKPVFYLVKMLISILVVVLRPRRKVEV